MQIYKFILIYKEKSEKLVIHVGKKRAFWEEMAILKGNLLPWDKEMSDHIGLEVVF